MFCLKDLHHIPNTETMKAQLSDRHKKYTFPKQILGMAENFICMNEYFSYLSAAWQATSVSYLSSISNTEKFTVYHY